MAQYIWPPIQSDAAPVEFILDGVPTQVSQDTAVPANSKPLPVVNLDSGGTPVDPATAQNQVLEIAQLTAINANTDQIEPKLDTANTTLSAISTQLTAQATAAKQDVGNASLASIDSKLTSPITVTGPLTDTQLRATPVPVSGSVTVVQATGTNLHAVIDSGVITSITNPVSITGSVGATISPSSSSTGALLSAKTTALASSLIIKASSGRLYELVGSNSNTSAQFIQLFDSATVPADGTVPEYTFRVEGLSNFSLDWQDLGRYFTTGIVVTNSSTIATKTIGTADCWFNGEYL